MARQRMGRDLNSCINMAGWKYLFRPNSEAAQGEVNNCIDHYLRTSGGAGVIANAQGQKFMIAPPRPSSPQPDSQGTERLMVQVALVAVLAVIGYFIYKA